MNSLPNAYDKRIARIVRTEDGLPIANSDLEAEARSCYGDERAKKLMSVFPADEVEDVRTLSRVTTKYRQGRLWECLAERSEES